MAPDINPSKTHTHALYSYYHTPEIRTADKNVRQDGVYSGVRYGAVY